MRDMYWLGHNEHRTEHDSYNFANTGLILGLRSANERRRYLVTTSLIGWAQA